MKKENDDDIKYFYQYMSYGILDLILLKNNRIKDDVKSVISEFLSLFPKYSKNNEEFFNYTFMALRYHFILFDKDKFEPGLLLSIYYEIKKYFSKVKDTSPKIEANLHIEIQKINNMFNSLYKRTWTEKEKILDNSKDSLRKIKKILTTSSSKNFIEKNLVQNKDNLVFISHTSFDKPMARRISIELEKFGIITWLDEKDISPGSSIPEEIAIALENCTHFLLIYSNNSKNKKWVITELNNIIMKKNSSQSDRPLIVPLLLDNLKPPLPISDIKGIQFVDYNDGMKELFQLFDVNITQQLLFIEVYSFIKKFEKVIETISWCFQADFFLGIDTEYFWDLYESEELINNFTLSPSNYDINHFLFSGTSHSQKEVTPYFDETFYTYQRSGILGLNVLNKYNEVIKRIIDFYKTK